MLTFFWSSVKVYTVYGFMEPISKALKLLKLCLWIFLLILKTLKIMAFHRTLGMCKKVPIP
jgi:hypothetical protein